MREKIKEVIKSLDRLSKNKKIKVISHNDTDGITSAAIFSKALERWNKPFSLEIVKNLEADYIRSLPEDQVLIFLDLASGSLPELAKKQTEIFIFDHHEIPANPKRSTTIPQKEIPKNVTMINPHIFEEENIAGSAICYLFAKNLSEHNKELANLAVVGMVGDMFEKNIGKVYDEIIRDAEVTVKKGILLYPATRPLDRTLENSTSPYIPGVSGSFKGVLEILREAGIQKTSKGYKSLAELSEDEMSNLSTAIVLRKVGNADTHELFGNIYLIRLFNTLEDAREVSAMINACSRMDYPEIALGLCLGNKALKKESEKIYLKYKKTISSALEQLPGLQKISGNDYTIINAQDKIKDTIIGTIASIISFSPLYPKGTIIVAMAYDSSSNKIKVSARISGRKGRNVREVLHKATIPLSGEVGGHHNAAGCLIPKEKESEFIYNLKNTLEPETIKI